MNHELTADKIKKIFQMGYRHFDESRYRPGDVHPSCPETHQAYRAGWELSQRHEANYRETLARHTKGLRWEDS